MLIGVTVAGMHGHRVVHDGKLAVTDNGQIVVRPRIDELQQVPTIKGNRHETSAGGERMQHLPVIDRDHGIIRGQQARLRKTNENPASLVEGFRCVPKHVPEPSKLNVVGLVCAAGVVAVPTRPKGQCVRFGQVRSIHRPQDRIRPTPVDLRAPVVETDINLEPKRGGPEILRRDPIDESFSLQVRQRPDSAFDDRGDRRCCEGLKSAENLLPAVVIVASGCLDVVEGVLNGGSLDSDKPTVPVSATQLTNLALRVSKPSQVKLRHDMVVAADGHARHSNR